MDTYKFVIELAKIVVPLILAILAFFLGRCTRFDTRREIASQKRLEEYYWPLIKWYSNSSFWVTPYSQADDEARELFFNLIVRNSYLACKETQRIIPDFHKAYVWADEYNKGNPKCTPSHMSELDIAFSRVINTVWQEYERLCKKQGYPAPLELRLPLVYEHKN